MMPFVRLNGMTAHIKMGKRRRVRCCCSSGRPAQRCTSWGDFLCDWQLSTGKTCDAPLCAKHAEVVGPDRHYCPLHSKGQPAQADLFTQGAKP